MKVFIIASFFATIGFAALTYRPVSVCTPTAVQTEVHCDGHYCAASTQSPNYLCYQSHE